jgi:hypothetical protein
MKITVTYKVPSENALNAAKLRRIRWMGPQSDEKHIKLLQQLN